VGGEGQAHGLSNDELRSLCAAARREPSLPPGFLAAVAGAAASALDGREDSLAADLFAEMPQDEPAVARGLSFRLTEWIEKDPGGVSTWLKRVIARGTVKGSQRREYERLITHADVMLAPVAQLPFIRSLPEGDQGELLGAALRRLKSAQDIQAFASGVITWPAAGPRDYVLRATMAKLLDHGGFAAAAAWLDSLPGASSEQKSDARLALTIDEPAAVEMMPQRATWILSQADPSGQADVAARLTANWVGRDYNAAGAWLHQNRTAPWFDAAASAFAVGVATKEPASAFDWALAIFDETTRRTALMEVLRRWRQNNPSAADDYLMASAVPEEWKAELKGRNPAPAPPSK
jgi:hypothetical protein